MEAERPAEAQLAELFCCGSGISARLAREQRDADQGRSDLCAANTFRRLRACAGRAAAATSTARQDRPIHTSSGPGARPVREEAVDAPREALERRGGVVAVVILKIVFLRSRVAAEDEEVRRRVPRESGLEPPSTEIRQGPALGVEGPGLDVRRQFASDDVELVALGEGRAVHGPNHVRVRERLRARASRKAVWLLATTSTSGSPADSRSSASQACAAGPVTLSAVPPDAERTLRRTVTSACFVGRSSLFRSVRGLLRFGAVTVTLVLEDLVCAALWRRGDRRKPQHSVAPYRSDCDHMINAYLRCRRHRNAKNLEAHS